MQWQRERDKNGNWEFEDLSDVKKLAQTLYLSERIPCICWKGDWMGRFSEEKSNPVEN